MVEAEAAKTLTELTNYGALGLCLVLALTAIVLLDRDRTKIRKRLEEEQQARVEDAKSYMSLALQLQEKEAEKVGKLDAIAALMKEMLQQGRVSQWGPGRAPGSRRSGSDD